MTNGVEYFFMCFLIVHISPSFAPFKIGSFVFLLVSHRTSFNILDTCPLSDK